MTAYIIPYFATLVFFVVVDMIWLGGIAKKIYGRALGSLMTRNVRWGAAGVFYVLYILGVVIFAIPERLIWIDIPWGTILTGAAALFGTWLGLSLA